jgi:DNA-directed RNA polymerase specialized sigma24 family protein
MPNPSADFENHFLPHLDAANNLAHLLVQNADDAEAVVQETYLRALRAFSRFRGGASRSWFLTSVRNTSFTWPHDNCGRAHHVEYRDELHVGNAPARELASHNV